METDSREGIVKETAEAKSDGRRINEADFQLERKGAQSRADSVQVAISMIEPVAYS